MGVPKFFGTWLRHQNFRAVITSNQPGNVYSLLIDLNSLIHQAAQIVYGYGAYSEGMQNPTWADVFIVLKTLIINLVEAIQPQNTLMLAVDGVAPQAKINQQRSRRFGPGPEPFDSNAISPGTAFMDDLDERISQWIQTDEMLPPQIIYSSHRVKGEGEQKIMSWLRNAEATSMSHIVHGLDTDLIFLSLISPVPRLYLWREDNNERTVLNIDNLKDEISSMTQTPANFVLMMIMLGNDFLPGQPSLRNFRMSINVMIEAYQRSGVDRLVNDSFDIVWDAFRTWLRVLAEYEPALLDRESRQKFKFPSSVMERAKRGGFNFLEYRNAWYERIIFPRITALLEPQYVPGTIAKISENYLEMVQWVIKYYTHDGGNVSDRIYYKRHYGPLILDLANAKPPKDTWRAEAERGLNLYEALVLMLPKRSAELLPENLQHFSSEMSPIGYLYPEKFIVDFDGVNDEWLGHPIIPIAGPEEIIGAVSSSVGKVVEGENMILRRRVVAKLS